MAYGPTRPTTNAPFDLMATACNSCGSQEDSILHSMRIPRKAQKSQCSCPAIRTNFWRDCILGSARMKELRTTSGASLEWYSVAMPSCTAAFLVLLPFRGTCRRRFADAEEALPWFCGFSSRPIWKRKGVCVCVCTSMYIRIEWNDVKQSSNYSVGMEHKHDWNN